MYDLNYVDLDGRVQTVMFDYEFMALQAVPIIIDNGGSFIWSNTFDIYNDAFEYWERADDDPISDTSLYGEFYE